MLIWHRGVGCDKKSGMMAAEKVDALIANAFEAFAAWVYGTRVWKALPLAQPTDSDPADAFGNVQYDDTYVQRVALRDFKFSLKHLFDKATTIQEPTFREVVALFRLKKQGDTTKNANAIHVKTFREIAVGDLEIVYPVRRNAEYVQAFDFVF